jgi:glycosyltransferase involved in cell wall biosynthesis
MSFRSAGAVQGAWQLANYIRRHKIKIVHSFDAPLNVFAVPVARAAGAPAVISSQRGHRDLTGEAFKRLLRVTDRMVDAVVVNCEFMRHYLVSQERVPEVKVRLCYNAVDADQYRRRTMPANAEYPVVGTVCSLRPEKAVDTLIRAFASLGGLARKLVIVGSGPEEAKLRTLATELGIGERCQFVAATSDVVEWLSQIDIFVLPSRSEALSNSLMEAMACGCCPIASNVGGNPELVEHGSNGFLFEADNTSELASHIRTLLADKSRRDAFADSSKRKMSQFTYARAARTMQQIYESVLNSAGLGASSSSDKWRLNTPSR